MGISPLHARLIVLEHKRRPLPDTVHLLGRQTVILTAAQADRLLVACGVERHDVVAEIDVQTRGAVAVQETYISDRMFFGMLGVKSVIAIDYTDYEGAEIIIDLNKTLPREYESLVYFLFGGSVLDNIFDPGTYMKNVSKLLAPSGRFFDQNILCQVHHPYLIVTPAWMVDYYVVNRFSNVKVYVAEYASSGFTHIYGLRPSSDSIISDFGPPRGLQALGIISIVEKGVSSSSDESPIQDQYRSEQDWFAYRQCLAAIEGGEDFFMFSQPTAHELVKLGVRRSKSFRYLGVLRINDLLDAQGLQAYLPDPRSVGGIRIVSATYGSDVLGMSQPSTASIYADFHGNVTEMLAGMANGLDRFDWIVDVVALGDPLPKEGKTLEVAYYYADERDPVVRTVSIEAEASGKCLSLFR